MNSSENLETKKRPENKKNVKTRFPRRVVLIFVYAVHESCFGKDQLSSSCDKLLREYALQTPYLERGRRPRTIHAFTCTVLPVYLSA